MRKNGEFVGVDEKFIPENEKWYRILFLYHLTIYVITIYYSIYTRLCIHILTNKPRCKNMDNQTYIEFDILYHCHILFHIGIRHQQ